jgi:Mpv17 / PMP22 family
MASGVTGAAAAAAAGAASKAAASVGATSAAPPAPLLTRLLAKYNAALAKRPMQTNIITGFVTAAVGDVICQLGFVKEPYRFRRTMELAATRALFMGPFLTWYFPFLARLAPGTGTKQVVKRLAFDQMIGSPISITGTFMFVGLFQGKPETIVPRIQEQLLPTMAAGACFWPFLHFANFKLVPVHHQALVAHTASLGWNAYISFQANTAITTSTTLASKSARFEGERQPDTPLGKDANLS